VTDASGTPGGQKNIADHGGVVYNGNFSGPIATSTGRDGRAVNVGTGVQDRLIDELREQLNEARRLLLENRDPGRAADREDAIAEIDSLDAELSEQREDRDAGKLRRRLKKLIGTLMPVTDIIGGFAAFLEIINDLKSIS
jgi:hypothetical protein